MVHSERIKRVLSPEVDSKIELSDLSRDFQLTEATLLWKSYQYRFGRLQNRKSLVESLASTD